MQVLQHVLYRYQFWFARYVYTYSSYGRPKVWDLGVDERVPKSYRTVVRAVFTVVGSVPVPYVC